jgi:hypothetical protein
LVFVIRATCPATLTSVHLTTLIIFDGKYMS